MSETQLLHHKMYFKIAKEKLGSAIRSEKSVIDLSKNPNPWKHDDLLD